MIVEYYDIASLPIMRSGQGKMTNTGEDSTYSPCSQLFWKHTEMQIPTFPSPILFQPYGGPKIKRNTMVLMTGMRLTESKIWNELMPGEVYPKVYGWRYRLACLCCRMSVYARKYAGRALLFYLIRKKEAYRMKVS